MNKNVYFTLPSIFKSKFHSKSRDIINLPFQLLRNLWKFVIWVRVFIFHLTLTFIIFYFSKVTLTLVEPILESNNRVHLISDLWGRTYIRRLDIYPVHIKFWRHHFRVDSKIKAGIDIVSDLNLKSSYFLSGLILLPL